MGWWNNWYKYSVKNSFVGSKIPQGQQSKALDKLINRYTRTPYLSDTDLVDGERYIQPELSNVLFCLMKDHENDNTNLYAMSSLQNALRETTCH